ncbi:MAG: hypothetical protein ACE5FI_18980, partial [Anaerolineales bacterium]
MATPLEKTGPSGAPSPLPPDVEQRKEVPSEAALPDPRTRLDVLVAGASIGVPGTTAATLGMFVEDNATGALLLLTVGHMLGAIEAAGDRVVLKLSPGTPVLQPGPADGGGDADIIAKVERAVLNERCDAGVAALIGERRYSDLLPDGGRIRGIALPRLGMRVRAFGRSGWLESTITLIEAATNVGYLAGVQQRFTGLFMTEKLSTGGDAGAVVLEADTNRAVGLIFAGSEQASVCIPIATVLRELDVRIPGMDQSIEVLEEQMLAELTAVNDTVG